MTADLDSLNQKFCIPNHVSFHIGSGGLVTALINNRFGTAQITLAGAHVMSYRPHGEREVFWSSPNAAHELSGAMRGGVPVCWPWFAEHPLDSVNLPIHGLVRTQIFDVLETAALPAGETRLRLSVCDSPATRPLWPHAYQFEIAITLGPSLSITWTARNPGSLPYLYTGALHPYFRVSNVHDLTLRGLEGTVFLDNYDGLQRKPQPGPVTFPQWLDNIYLDTTQAMTIEDPGFKRLIHLRKTGSSTSVVWNPDRDDVTFADVGAGQHIHFVCVEAANAADDVITVAPGEEACLGMEIEIGPWREL